jgi:effector-binding domain-containing protein
MQTKPKIQIQSVPPAMYAFIRQWVKWEDAGDYFDMKLNVIASTMTDANMPPQFPPSIFIHNVDNDKEESELSAAIQTNNPIKIIGGGTIEFPAGQALLVEHWGPLENSNEIHQAMGAFVDENNLIVGVVIEEYPTNPEVETNPLKWLTRIIYRLYDGKEVPRIVC